MQTSTPIYLVAAAAAAIVIATSSMAAVGLEVQVREIMAGANGSSKVQFLVIEQEGSGQNHWGPQAGETHSRAVLQFFDAGGRETGTFAFPADPGTGGSLLTLVATAEFAALPGAPQPDVLMPPLLSPGSGMVCFTANPHNPIATFNECVAYGNYTGATGRNTVAGVLVPAGRPAPGLSTTDVVSLRRIRRTGRNDDFLINLTPTPTNLAGVSHTMQAMDRVQQGSRLFHEETFMGNGRTCATCHAPEDSFGLRPASVQRRFATVSSTYDPLFVAERAPSGFDAGFDYGLNTLTLTSAVATPAPCLGELRGIVTDTSGGRARVIARVSSTTYLVGGGLSPGLSGTVTDGTCTGVVSSIAAGDLGAVPGSPFAGLEDPRRMRTSRSANFPQGRALFLENVDGLTNPAVFRKSPHLLNLRFTAPFGFSGNIGDLRTFSTGAVAQHFPRTLARSHESTSPDFRMPTADELAALEAFMLAQEFPAGNDPGKFNLDRFALTAAERRGRDAFFGNQAKCSRCHGGPVLALTTVAIAGKPVGVNASFNTGVTQQAINGPGGDNLPCEPATPSVGACGSREFNVPQLFNVRNLTPLFHDGSAATVRDAVDFYDTPTFNNSPAGRAIGGINLPANVRRDITAFLEALVTTGQAPVITLQPVSQQVAADGTAVFAVAASGTPAPNYEWQVSANQGSTWTALTEGTPYRGTSSPTLVIAPAASALNDRRYRVVVSNATGTSTSAVVTLTVLSPPSPPVTDAAPFGQVDTPAQNAPDVAGAIAVTGWALDDEGVSRVQVYRDCVSSDSAAVCQVVLGARVVFVADAPFVRGARPDVEAAYPGAADAARAGWGALILTNVLPDVTTGLSSGGQGALSLYVIATDVAGQQTLLGRSVTDHTPTAITMENQTIARPFGAIDTPAQGAIVSGVVNNFGWALTPDSNLRSGDGDVDIPSDGRTVTVFIDGLPVSTVAFGQCRGTVGNPVPAGTYCDDDVASAFGGTTPQSLFSTRVDNPSRFRNLDAGRGAIGAFTFDSRTLGNGRHTIAWSVTDSAGRTEGIGSRFFEVQNAGAAGRPSPPMPVPTASRVHSTGITGRQGFALDTPLMPVSVNEDGVAGVAFSQTSRLELLLGDVSEGYLLVNGQRRALPDGGSLVDGRFAWAPGPGYLGTYRLVFPHADGETQAVVDVTVVPDGAPGTLRLHLDSPSPGETMAGALRVDGWAFDPAAFTGTGISAVHVWAVPVDRAGLPARFLGEASLRQARPDVAAVFGPSHALAGFHLRAVLEPGTYDITAYVWVARTQRWEDARTARVTIR